MNTQMSNADAVKPDAAKLDAAKLDAATLDAVQHPQGAKTVPPRPETGVFGHRLLHPFGSMDIGASHLTHRMAPSQFVQATTSSPPLWLFSANSTGNISPYASAINMPYRGYPETTFGVNGMPTDDIVPRVFPNNHLSAHTVSQTPLPMPTTHHEASLGRMQTPTGAENTPYTANHAINIWRSANNKILPPARHPPTNTQTNLPNQEAQNKNGAHDTKYLRPTPINNKKRAMATPRSRLSDDPNANYQPESSVEDTTVNTRSTRRRLAPPSSEAASPASRATPASSGIVVNGHQCTVDPHTGAFVASTHGVYKVSPQLHGIRKALGEATWSEYVALVEKLVAGLIEDDEYAKQEGALFMTYAPNMKAKIRKMVVKMVEMGKWVPGGEGGNGVEGAGL
jgi:hypothetical protein